jgi:hypothetical protein
VLLSHRRADDERSKGPKTDRFTNKATLILAFLGAAMRRNATATHRRVNVENIVSMPPRQNKPNANSQGGGFVTDVWLKLLCCLMLDAVGFFSFLLPALGELSDVAWGPISAFLLYRLFPNMPMMAIVNLAEETLPFLGAFRGVIMI